MDQALIDRLAQITDEERRILRGESQVDQTIYTDQESFTVDIHKLAALGQEIMVRPHTRFVAFPQHGHNYVEMMYVCSGTVTHVIDHKEIVLKKGDLLFLNQHTRHSIKKCEEQDIAVNFLLLPGFFDTALKMIDINNYIGRFILNTLRQSESRGEYLVFETDALFCVNNILENLIYSVINNRGLSDARINKNLFGLLLLYLYDRPDSLRTAEGLDFDEMLTQTVRTYINTEYQSASLSALAERMRMPVSQLSRFIKGRFGRNFIELLTQKRFEVAKALLRETNISVRDIIAAVGYQNASYFHKRFKAFYHSSPRAFRTGDKK